MGCRCSPTLVQSPAMKIWLGDINETWLQGLNLSSTEDSAFHHDSTLLQLAMNAVGVYSQESEMINTQGWFNGHNASISNTRMVLEKCVNWLQNTCSSLSIISVIWELHQVTNHLLVAASAFLKLLDSLKYFYSQCVMLTHPSWCACSAKPVVTLSMKRSYGE